MPATGLPVVKGDSIVAFQGERLLAVCVDSEGKERWRLPEPCSNAAIVEDQVWIHLAKGGLLLTDLTGGKPVREESVEYGFAVIVDDGFVERGWPEPSVRFRSLARGCPIRWTHSFGDDGDITEVDLRMAADGHRCFVAVAEAGETRIAALDLGAGTEVWTRHLRDVDKPESRDRWNPAAAHGLLIMATAKGTLALDVKDGRVAWQSRSPAMHTVYGDRVYLRGSNPAATGQPSQIFVLDVTTGKLVWRRDYPEVLKKARDNRLMGYLAVSETHIYSGDNNGAVWAFAAGTGEPVWSHRPKGSEAFAPWTLPVAVDGRLFIASAGDQPHLFCYEQTQPADAAPAGGEEVDEQGSVEFRIEKAHRRQELNRATPYFAPGGAWTVLSCRLADKGTFFLAVPESGKAGDGYIWVSSVEDADALLKAIRKAFPARGKAAPKGSRVKPPTPVDVAVLGSDVGETGSGRGTWTFSKWTGEDGAPEFYVNWSLADGRGVIAEKDEGQRKALLRLFAGLAG